MRIIILIAAIMNSILMIATMIWAHQQAYDPSLFEFWRMVGCAFLFSIWVCLIAMWNI